MMFRGQRHGGGRVGRHLAMGAMVEIGTGNKDIAGIARANSCR